jgi:hypothetical protein
MAIIIDAPPWLLPFHPQSYHEKEAAGILSARQGAGKRRVVMASIIASQNHRAMKLDHEPPLTTAPVGAGRRTIKATWLTITEAGRRAVAKRRQGRR